MQAEFLQVVYESIMDIIEPKQKMPFIDSNHYKESFHKRGLF